MAKPESRPIHIEAFHFVVDILSGRHALSIAIPIALWLLDAVLCGLVIWKVPCGLFLLR